MKVSANLLRQPLLATPETPLLTVIARMGGGQASGDGDLEAGDLGSGDLGSGDLEAGEVGGSEETGTDPERDVPVAQADAAVNGVVVVVDQRVVGLLTLGDVGRLVAQPQNLETITVGQVMSHPVITLPQASLAQPWAILDLLHQHRIRHLPVVDDQGAMVGMVTQTSLIQSLGPLALYQARAQRPAPLIQRETGLPAHGIPNIASKGIPDDPPDDPPDATPAADSAALSTATMAQLVHTVPGTLCILERTAQGGIQITYISPQAQELYGISAAAMVQDGQRFFDLIHPADQPDYLAALEVSATTRQPFCQEHRIVTPTGQEKWIRVHGQPEPLPQGGVRWFGIALEITGRKQAEQDLILASRRLREAQRIAQIGNWEMDLWTNTLHWSEEIFRIFEIDSQQFGASYEAFL